MAHDIEALSRSRLTAHKGHCSGHLRFNVDLFGPTLLVTMIEGRVVVSSASSWVNPTKVDMRGARIPLDAGEQIVFSPKKPPECRPRQSWAGDRVAERRRLCPRTMP